MQQNNLIIIRLLSTIVMTKSVRAMAQQLAPRTAPLRVIKSSSLYISQPDPRMFGNPPNAPDAAWSIKSWLTSRFHFSFAEYSGGPGNFGVLRVVNDDIVQPKRGFGAHPHRDMEIVTYVVEGSLWHKDNKGNSESLGRGSVQFMSAGTGVTHSEANKGSKPLRFVQSWIVPRKRGLTPSYGSASNFDRGDAWAYMVGDADAAGDARVRIHQDLHMYATELSPTKCVDFDLGTDRQAYVLVLEGDVTINKAQLSARDACEVKGPLKLDFSAGAAGAHVLVYEMALSSGIEC